MYRHNAKDTGLSAATIKPSAAGLQTGCTNVPFKIRSHFLLPSTCRNAFADLDPACCAFAQFSDVIV